uniref:Uncharacterized protein n=1 Tax=Rhizophora mucronata TaxID=61149 RepID=A0A2P2NX72_RHIMU
MLLHCYLMITGLNSRNNLLLKQMEMNPSLDPANVGASCTEMSMLFDSWP